MGAHPPPFDITRDKFVDPVAALIYVVVLVLERRVVRGVAEAQGRRTGRPWRSADADDRATGGGAVRAPRAAARMRTSAYGRPVTTSE